MQNVPVRPHTLDTRPSVKVDLPQHGISASDIARLRRCSLQGALALSGVKPKLSFSIDSALGTAIHKFLEAANQGTYDELDTTALTAELDNHIREQTNLVSNRWYEKGQLPLSRAKDSAIKKKRAVKLAEVQVAKQRQSATTLQSGHPRPAELMGLILNSPASHAIDMYKGIEVEKVLKSKDGFLTGRADVFFLNSEGKPVVEDWKTGDVLDENGVLKKEIEDQLKLYGLMVYEASGKVPILQVRILSGSPIQIRCSADELNSCRESAEAEFRKLKNEITKLDSAQHPYGKLAKPSDPTRDCRFCTYRPICSTYINKYFLDRPEFEHWDCIGKISSLETQANGAMRVTLRHPDLEGEQLILFRKSSLGRHSALEEVKEGDTVGIFNVSFSWKRNVYEDRQSTVVYEYGYDPFSEIL